MPRRPLTVAILIGLAAELLFLVRLAVPHIPVFDETHYVPAARALLELSRPANIEHPLLGKTLIAIGMAVFGDNPFGWRVMSTIAATGVVVGAFAILQLAFGRVRTSLFGASLVLLNFTVYVQARIAMLDGFMAAFVIAGIALFIWALQRGGWGRWLATAAAFGLAAACKWTALPYAGLAGAAFLWIKWRDRDAFPEVGLIGGAILFGAGATAAYIVTFAPAFFYASEPMTLARLLPFQAEMYARQTQLLPQHTYQSPWWSWPIDMRPVWYLYERADGAQRGILMIGNPVIMWGGLIAVAACVWAWIKSADPRPLAAASLWLASVAMWAAIPKSLGFYYYYYLSSIFICFAIAAAFDHWRDRSKHWDESFAIVAFGLLLYFFPILSGQALPDAGAFRRWTWFDSWI